MKKRINFISLRHVPKIQRFNQWLPQIILQRVPISPKQESAWERQFIIKEVLL